MLRLVINKTQISYYDDPDPYHITVEGVVQGLGPMVGYGEGATYSVALNKAVQNLIDLAKERGHEKRTTRER